MTHALGRSGIALFAKLIVGLSLFAPHALAQPAWPELARDASAAEVRALLEGGADLTRRDGQGFTALMLAAQSNPDDVVTELLVEAGSDLEARTASGATVLHLVLRRGVPLERLLVLLQAGADTLARNASGETPLMVAVSSATSSAIVRELVRAGAEVDARDASGASAMHYAVRSSADPEVLRAVLEAGAWVDARDREGRTALMVSAMAAGGLDLVRVLVASGAELDAADAEGRTPLMYAVAHNPDSRVVAALLAAGADVDRADAGGRTALMHAAASSVDPTVVELLLDAGADAGARSAAGEFPADYALRNEVLQGSDTYARLRAAATAREQVLFREVQRLETPVAVVVAAGAPASVLGIGAASQVYQMPVSVDRSGLLLVFSEDVPERVGPVDPVDSPFVELAVRLGATLVHDGGSPGALAVLGELRGPSLDAQRSMDAFEPRDEPGDAPLVALGEMLLRAALRGGVGTGYRTLQVEPFVAPADLLDAHWVEISLLGEGVSAFAFEEATGTYTVVNDRPSGRLDEPGVRVDAVLAASIDARPFPNDPLRRLSIPLRGGPARLFLQGKVLEGQWGLAGDGVTFVSTELGRVDLVPFTVWTVFTPRF